VAKVAERRAAEEHRPLEDHRLAPADAAVGGLAGPEHAAGSRPQQAVQQPQQQALAGAVRAHDDGAQARAQHEVEAVDQPPAAGLEDEPVGLERQDRRRRARRRGDLERERPLKHRRSGPQSDASP
jgi:hypothetical protein